MRKWLRIHNLQANYTKVDVPIEILEKSDIVSMQKNGYPPNNRPSHSFRATPSSEVNDYALELLWICIGLELAYCLGLYLKKTSLTGGIFFFLTISAPALIVIVASSWKRAFKLSFILTLIVPVFTTFLIILVTTIMFLKNPASGKFLSRIVLSLRTGATLWLVLVVTTIGPPLIFGVAAKFLWNLVTKKK
ncbi:MAG TPA: hypothetical protein VGE46_06340 [Bdellovibrio sp.]